MGGPGGQGESKKRKVRRKMLLRIHAMIGSVNSQPMEIGMVDKAQGCPSFTDWGVLRWRSTPPKNGVRESSNKVSQRFNIGLGMVEWELKAGKGGVGVGE